MVKNYVWVGDIWVQGQVLLWVSNVIMRKIVMILHGCEAEHFLLSPPLFLIKTVAIKWVPADIY